ncbi:MAG TPA: Holliday junction branch migration protein RuvA [Bacteroidota bacterium]|nr:Holliday junction branch migration protein RuvA [Bacteroidota bacterium]
MIEFLAGRLVSKEPVSAVVDVGGVGYVLHISLATYESLPAPGADLRILTHLHVREDAMQLFGFASAAERELFLRLQTISGIGARTALTILSGINPEELRTRVLAGDVPALTRIPGIGRKTAERIVVELRDSMARMHPAAGEGAGGGVSQRDEALLALSALGYARNAAEKAVADVLRGNASMSTGEIVKQALKALNS